MISVLQTRSRISPRISRVLHVVVTLLLALLGPPVLAQTSAPTILWPDPSTIPFLTPLSNLQLNAWVVAGPPVPVPLDGFYNNTGITTSGFNFSTTGGYDYSGWAWAQNQFPSDATTGKRYVQWQGVTFPLGPANVPDVVSNTTVTLPAGSFGTLLMLGSIVNNALPATAHFIINYTDGTSTAVDQQMSDWVNPMNYSGESLAFCTPTRYLFNGSIDYNSSCVYGYQITLDPTRTVKNLVLPALPDAPNASSDRHPDVEIMSMALLPVAVPGTLTYTPASGSVLNPGTQTLSASFTPAGSGSGSASATVPLVVTPPATPITPALGWQAPAPILYKTPLSATQLNASATTPVGPVLVPLGPVARFNAFYPDNTLFQEKGVDGLYHAFSAAQLGTSLTFAGFTFPLGQPQIPDSASSSTITLPTGNYASLSLLGIGANGSQLEQPFTVTYTDGTTTSTPLDLSSWDAAKNFADETIVATTSYQNTSTGVSIPGTFDVYGYQIPLDPTRSVKTLTLPSNPNVLILAAGLSPGTNFVVAGRYVYNPPSGTILPIGTHPLAVDFSPTDNLNFLPNSAKNSIVVNAPVLTVEADSKTKVYGTPNPTFTGSVSGQVGGDVFTESFATSATTTSPAGQYAIVPSVSPQSAFYTVNLVPGTLTITKAPVTGTLTSSAAALLERQTTTLTATITSTTSGTPSGTVSFFQNQHLVGTSTLNGGVATLVPALPFGTDVLTAVYSGDNNFEPLTLAGPSLTVSPLDFSLTAPGGPTFSGAIGTSPSLLLHLAPLHGVYANNITYTVSGGLPPLAGSGFDPAWLPQSANAADIRFSVQTRPLQGEKVPADRAPIYALLGMVLILPLTALRRVRNATVSKMLLLLLSLGVLSTAGGCGSGYHPASYPLVVTATDGTVTHTLSLTLDITPPN